MNRSNVTSRGRDKKAGGDQQSSGNPTKKEKKTTSRSSSASKQAKGILSLTSFSPFFFKRFADAPI
jgi:hypothetical protein